MRPLAPSHTTSAPSMIKTTSINNCVRRAGGSMAVTPRGWSLSDSLDLNLLQGNWRAWTVAGIARHAGNFVGHILTFHHFTENRVPAVEPWRGSHGNEELATIRVWTGIRHRQ